MLKLITIISVTVLLIYFIISVYHYYIEKNHKKIIDNLKIKINEVDEEINIKRGKIYKLEKEIDDLIVQIEISLDEKKENQK